MTGYESLSITFSFPNINFLAVCALKRAHTGKRPSHLVGHECTMLTYTCRGYGLGSLFRINTLTNKRRHLSSSCMNTSDKVIFNFSNINIQNLVENYHIRQSEVFRSLFLERFDRNHSIQNR